MTEAKTKDELLARLADAAGLIGLTAEKMPQYVIEVKADYRSPWAYELTIKERRFKNDQ